MAKTLVTDELWALIGPLLPRAKPRRAMHPGRKPLDDRRILEGILFVLKSGIAWADLPPQFGCSGTTCWRRLRDWNAAGVWKKLQKILLSKVNGLGLLDWSRCVIDTSSVRAVFGGAKPVRTPRIAANWGRSITS